MNALRAHYRTVARILAWIGIAVIIVLSVVPANDRPVTGVGQLGEHVSAFALVGVVFAIGYPLPLRRLFLLAVSFCVAIELLQVPLATRHARFSDLVINIAAACLAMWIVHAARYVGKR